MSRAALELAAEVRSGQSSAAETTQRALAAIAAGDGAINSFTAVHAERAMRDAERVDRAIASGRDPGPLAGVPFAVKDLFDVQGEVTLAGSVLNRSDPPARRDAAAISRICASGGVLVGSLNMDEFAYGFTTENSHYGPCHNPHDLARVAGGSSGGSAAAVAAGFVPLALGSDTNGSIRVPAALCGVWGCKPTFAAIPRDGMFPFCESLDHVGFVTASAGALRTVLGALDPGRPSDAHAPSRIAIAAGHFAQGGEQEVFEATGAVAEALGARRRVNIPWAAAAREAAMLITAFEAGRVHLERLRTRAGEFDPMTRPRLLAGAMVPREAHERAQRFREAFRQEIRRVFETVDVLLAPATPFAAPLIGQRSAVAAGVGEVATQSYLGVFTQPLSFIGLPVVTVPVSGGCDGMPLGVQVIAAPGNEARLLTIAEQLESDGVALAQGHRAATG